MDARDFRLRSGATFRTIPCGRKGENERYRLELENANDNIAGGPDGRDCEIDAEHETLVTGHGIYLPAQAFDASDTKGRAWLETLEGEKVGRFDVTVSGESLLHLRLHLDAANPPRDCRLVIETYGTSAAAESGTAPLLSYRRKVKLIG